ncbi:MAG: hypothetical protein ABIR91_03615 [Candidatus Saccharimonadales bacterium]
MSELATIQPTQELTPDDDGSRELHDAADVLTESDFNELEVKAMELAEYADVVNGLNLAVDKGDSTKMQLLIGKYGPDMFTQAILAEDTQTFQDVHDKLEPAVTHSKVVDTEEGAYGVDELKSGYGNEQEVVGEAENALFNGGLQLIVHDHPQVFDAFLASGKFEDLQTSIREVFTVEFNLSLPKLEHAQHAINRELDNQVALVEQNLTDTEQLSRDDLDRIINEVLDNRGAHAIMGVSVDKMAELSEPKITQNHDLAA